MTRTLRQLIICSCLLALSQQLLSQSMREMDFSLELRGDRLQPPANAREWMDSMRQHYLDTRPLHVIVQFYRLPEDSLRQWLKDSGILLGNYIPNRAYTTILNVPLPQIDLEAAGIRSITPFRPEWKIDDKVATELNFSQSFTTRILVAFVKDAPLAEIEQLVQKLGGSISDRKFQILNTFELTLPQNKVQELATSPWVRYIQFPARDRKLNDDNRNATGATFLQAPVPIGPGLDGSGITIGIGDNSSGLFHVDAQDRVVNFNPAPPLEHGMHTTGTAAGAGILNPRYAGMAPASGILAHLYNLVWAQTGTMYDDYDMTLTNNSYAAITNDCNYAGLYDQYSRMLDELSQDYPKVLHVFAAGNDGNATCPPFPQGYGTVVGSYQAAKNVLVVTSTFKTFGHHTGASKGPVRDGRLRPDVAAFGKDIYSCKLYNDYRIESGTSMAAPAATGAMALLAQRYKQVSAGAPISGDLLKALVMNGAMDIGIPGPDYMNGYGVVDVYRSLEMLIANNYFALQLGNGNDFTYSITVPPNTGQLKVMLYWADAPADPVATKTLVNDLDLEVTDPANNIRYPYILDPAPANVTNPATTGPDHLNNTEQVVINNPQPGNYTIRIKGTLIPQGPQRYVLVYDFVPRGIQIKAPAGGVPVAAIDTMRIYWDATDDPNSFTIEYSENNGASWTTIDNNVPADQRVYRWEVPAISTHQAKLRISRNGTSQQASTEPFTINPQPILHLASTQCPGYIALEWNAIPNATAYEILQKKGPALQPVDTVTTTSYAIAGLSPDSVYYVAVRPFINGQPGYRSNAQIRQPSDGDCSGTISDGDLSLVGVMGPHSGRIHTSSELTFNETLFVQLRNHDDVPVNNYAIHLSINGGPWLSGTHSVPLPANDLTTIALTSLDLAVPGDYLIRVAVQNLQFFDPVAANDTITTIIRHLKNDPVDLHALFMDDFEDAGRFTALKDTIGFTPNSHWDYANSTDSGRLRSFVSSDVTISGNRSLSMDLLFNRPDNQNYITGTFNLGAYSITNTEARIEFDYKIHGQPKFQEGNQVWIRGDDTKPWLPLFQIDTSAAEGVVMPTGSLSVTNALALNGQDFSSSFQVRIGQRDTSAIAFNEYGNGLTIDNFKLYSVKNDVQLLSIVNPVSFNCGLEGTVPLTVKLYNSDSLPQYGVQLFYRLDSGTVVTAAIDTLLAKDTLTYTFAQQLDISAVGYHTLNVWISADGDTYLPNDSILNFRIRHQPVVRTFPYLEDFETGDGHWYTIGRASSWQHGSPASVKIKNAASGTRAWMTNLTGTYNDNEESYLYSPCFDLTGLSHPMLSFSLATDIENCGDELCDFAFIEYSEDGVSWTKLGVKGEGTNWYGGFNVWNEQDHVRWRVASIHLPEGKSSLKLRFGFISDPGAARDGIAIDDIHIFDRIYGIYEDQQTTAQVKAGSVGWASAVRDDRLLASFGPELPGDLYVTVYRHDHQLNPVTRQYNLARNYVIQGQAELTDSMDVRLFIVEKEVVDLIQDQSCDTCSRPADAYRLGITVYDDPNPAHENGSLADNVQGTYTFIPYTGIRWVPYDNGYYAETRLKSFSELWFNTGIPHGTYPLNILYPNPASDQLHILWSAVPGAEMQLVLMDMLGRVVYQATAVAQAYDNHTTFRLPTLEPAVYIARFIIGNQTYEEKVLVK